MRLRCWKVIFSPELRAEDLGRAGAAISAQYPCWLHWGDGQFFVYVRKARGGPDPLQLEEYTVSYQAVEGSEVGRIHEEEEPANVKKGAAA